MKSKNNIYLKEEQNCKILQKTYKHKLSYLKEEFVLNILSKSNILAPSIIQKDSNSLYLSYIEGKTALHHFEQYEADGDTEKAENLLYNIYKWLEQFHTHMAQITQKPFIKGDNNLNNFLISSNKIYGLDFEEAKIGNPCEDISTLASFLLGYHPANTPFKNHLIAYLKDLSSKYYQEHDFELMLKKNTEKIQIQRYLKKQSYCSIILAGGKASRMGGKNKALLTLDNISFVDKIGYNMGFCDHIYLSLDKTKDFSTPYPKIYDSYDHIGPIGAIATALEKIHQERALFIPCDSPLIQQNTMQKLLHTSFKGKEDATIAIDENGRIYPLCGVYKKNCLPYIQKLISNKTYKVRQLYESINVGYVKINSNQLHNINTPEQYQQLTNSNNHVRRTL